MEDKQRVDHVVISSLGDKVLVFYSSIKLQDNQYERRGYLLKPGYLNVQSRRDQEAAGC